MVAQIRKRDDRVEAFDVSKITRAIFRAASSVGGVDIAMASNIAQHVKDKIDLQFEGTVPSVEQVQDVVEHTLVHEGHAKTAKAYILYRDRRSRARNSRSHLMQTMRDLTFKSRGAIDLKRENANIDGECTMGVMLRYGSEASKEMSLSELISPEFADAHVNGDIHIHDLDFYPLCWNCCQIPAGKLLEAGFNTGHGNLRTASNIQSASSLACIIIQSNQNDMFGGQSIPKFDYDLAPFVAKTFVKKLVDVMRVKYDDMLSLQELEQIKSACWAHYKSQGTLVDPSTWKGNSDAWELEVDTTTLLGTLCVIIGAHTRTYHSSAYLNSPREYVDTALHILNLALDRTEKETYQGMEIVVHNLNTMHSRAGAQVPFSSLNYGTDTSAEGRMVIKNILLALDAGMGDGETPIFPIHIFKVKDGINGKPGDPNYDLFKLSIRVSAKRLFPNWVFLDAPFNAQYYKPGDPDTEAATMGCVQKDETITYKIGKFLCVESISRAFDKLAGFNPVLTFGDSKYIDLTNLPVRIYDSNEGKFVKVKKIIRNPNKNNWKLLKFNNGRNIVLTEDHPLPIIGRGRTMVKDLEIGDRIRSVTSQYSENYIDVNPNWAWLLGLILCDATYDGTICISIGLDEYSIYERIEKCCTRLGFTCTITEQNRGNSGHYYDVRINTGRQKEYVKTLTDMFGGVKKADRHIPNEVFSWTYKGKLAFLAGMFDADGHVGFDASKKLIRSLDLGSTNKELALQQMHLMQALGGICKCYRNHYKSRSAGAVRYKIEARFDKKFNEKLYKYISCDKKKKFLLNDYLPVKKEPSICTLVELNTWVEHDFSYDVETESDRFDVSGIQSHNCRTRVVGNTFDPQREIFTGRGNLSFISLNLPRLGLKHRNDGNLEAFFEELDEKINMMFDCLLQRFEVQAKRQAKNFPFLIGQGVWIDGESLGPEDEVRDVIKHGTLSIGFIGLAECLKALLGVHHGESEQAQKLGLEIVGRMRAKADAKSKETGLNFSVIGSPAEGLSGRFIRMDRKVFGSIAGVTDRDYYTNSNHVPVYYPISAARKIDIEAPYHALENGGHITYVEVDGDPLNNLEAMEQIVEHMKTRGIGYGSINHPVDRDPVCGYTGIIGDTCPRCGRHDGEAVSEKVLKAIRKRITKDNRSEEERIESSDRIPNVIL